MLFQLFIFSLSFGFPFLSLSLKADYSTLDFIPKSIILIRFQSKLIHINYSPSILVSKIILVFKIILIDSNLLILLNSLKNSNLCILSISNYHFHSVLTFGFYLDSLLNYAPTFSYALLLSLWIDDDYCLLFGCFIFG